MGLVILCLLAASFVLSLALTAVIRNVAPRVGFVDRPGHRKIHYIPKPLGGGVAIFLAMAIPMVGGLLFVHFGEPPTLGIHMIDIGPTTKTVTDGTLDPLSIYWPGIRHQTPMALKF